MKRVAIFSLLTCLCLSGHSQGTNESYPMATISTLNKAKSDTLCLIAYVFSIYTCPPCPPGAQCKPCIENHFTAVEGETNDPMQVPIEKRLRVFAQNPEALIVGKRYLFTVTFRNKKASPSDNVTLVSFKSL